jgi:hypothetical protein
MNINNYIRYFIGAALLYSILPVLQGTSLSIYNFSILILLIFVIIKDVSNGNNV